MTTATSNNGHITRKNLSSQLDRLDSILDALSDGLNEAVATVVEEAVGKAVEMAVKEVLCNPDVLRALRHQAAPQPTPEAQQSPTVARTDFVRRTWSFGRTTLGLWLGGVSSGLGRARAWGAGKLWQAARAVSTKAKALAANCGLACSTLGAWLPLAWQCRIQVAVAAGVGTAVAIGCWWAGPAVASTVCGLAGFAGALVACMLNGLRQAQAANA